MLSANEANDSEQHEKVSFVKLDIIRVIRLPDKEAQK